MKDIDKKMTLDEAIQHCHEVAKSCENKECALNHEQLANWLEELTETILFKVILWNGIFEIYRQIT